jgi:UDP-N-acetylglucosamine--N-acetylmuramyl-(pentapeptide) pyrophosphoryl-undecaprenol N-acetylglucosamine transferase
MKKILITGGHAGVVAYSLVKYMKMKGIFSKYKIYFIGSKYAMEGNKTPTFESRVLSHEGVIFKSIISGRIQTKFTRWTIPSIIKIPLSFIHALIILINTHPNVVLSLGGYVSFSVVVAAKLLRIPVVIHEQTSVIGRANKMSLFFADVITISRESTIPYLNKRKYINVGCPIPPFQNTNLLRKRTKELFQVFISGGSRGSRTINDVIMKLLPKLLLNYKIVHQVGREQYNLFKSFKSSLNFKLSKNYEVYEFISPEKFDEILASSDVFISRAGAGSVSHAVALKIPSIFIPLSISYLNEQFENANYAKEFGIAKIIEQKDLSPIILKELIDKTIKDKDSIYYSVKNKTSPDLDASYKLIDVIIKVINKKPL